MNNREIRAKLAQNGIRMKTLATAMNISPCTLSHYFLQELNDRQKERVEKAIEEILKGTRHAGRKTST